MSKIELKFGRKVVAWEDNVDSIKGRYIKHISHEREHWILDDTGFMMPFQHVEPDLEAPPMNGDEVEWKDDYKSEWYEIAVYDKVRYIGKKSDGKHMIEINGISRLCDQVRHPQPEPSKRERVLQLVKSYKGGEEKVTDEILKICEVKQ